jgi:hypothetical protein
LGKSLDRVPLMSAGEANEIKFAIKDLFGVATAFDALGLSGRVPLKFGHNDDQPLTDGQPALGWVSRVYVEGDTLYADFVDVPTSVYELIRSGAYKFVSVELLRDVQAGTRKIPWVLDAVALLGADQPAFGTLGDLQSLTMKRKPVFQARARVEFRRGVNLSTGGPKKAMSEDNFDEKLAAALKKQREEMRAEFKADLDRVKAESKAEADARVAKAQAESHRAQIKAKFEDAVQNRGLLPAKRESFYKFNRVDDDAVVMSITLADVDQYIAEFATKKAGDKPTTQQGEAAEDEKGLRADQIVPKRAMKLAYSRNQDPKKLDVYMSAVKEVLNSDPKLAEAYKYMPDTEYRQAS